MNCQTTTLQRMGDSDWDRSFYFNVICRTVADRLLVDE